MWRELWETVETVEGPAGGGCTSLKDQAGLAKGVNERKVF
jgi:hypothetical protein